MVPIACYFVMFHSNLLVVVWKPVAIAADLLLGSLPVVRSVGGCPEIAYKLLLNVKIQLF